MQLTARLSYLNWFRNANKLLKWNQTVCVTNNNGEIQHAHINYCSSSSEQERINKRMHFTDLIMSFQRTTSIVTEQGCYQTAAHTKAGTAKNLNGFKIRGLLQWIKNHFNKAKTKLFWSNLHQGFIIRTESRVFQIFPLLMVACRVFDSFHCRNILAISFMLKLTVEMSVS